jgi:hypothetical protein
MLLASIPESKFNIISRSKAGLTIRKLINERPELFDFGNIRISIVYIQLGGNDLSRKSAEKTATDIVSFANFLNELAPIVIVGQLLFRNQMLLASNIALRIDLWYFNIP